MQLSHRTTSTFGANGCFQTTLANLCMATATESGLDQRAAKLLVHLARKCCQEEETKPQVSLVVLVSFLCIIMAS